MKLLLSLFLILAFVAPQIYSQNSTSCNVTVVTPPRPPTTIPATPTGFTNINTGAGTGGLVTFVWNAATDTNTYSISWMISTSTTWTLYASGITGTTYNMSLNPMFSYTISLTPTNVFGNGNSASVVVAERQ